MVDKNQTIRVSIAEDWYPRQVMDVHNAIQIMKAKDKCCGSKLWRPTSMHAL